MKLLEVEDLSVVYEASRSDPVRAVREVSLTLDDGEFVGLVGESGCGKSTLGYAITRMLRPPARLESGRVIFSGTDIASLSGERLRRMRSHGFALVLQSGMNALNPVRSIENHFGDVLRAHQRTSRADVRRRAIELLDLDASSRVLDLYCGIGNFTLALARRARSAVGVEADARLVATARHNAERHALGNAQFHCLDLTQPAAHQAACMQEAYSHVLIAPPRAGARAMLPTVARLGPQRLLYISCHPGSLARDIGMLVHDHGLKLLAAGVLDMFPQTMHVESIALLEGPAARSRTE